MKTLHSKTTSKAKKHFKPPIGGAFQAYVEGPGELEFLKYKTEVEAELESFRSLANYGQGALRTSLLINGGATVALLSFIAAISANPNLFFSVLVNPLVAFSTGVFFGAIASGSAYGQAYANYADQEVSAGRWFKRTIFALSCSYLCFILGCHLAFVAIRGL